MPSQEDMENLERLEELKAARREAFGRGGDEGMADKKEEAEKRVEELTDKVEELEQKLDTGFGSVVWWNNAPVEQLMTLILRLYRADKITLEQSRSALKGVEERKIPNFIPLSKGLRTELSV